MAGIVVTATISSGGGALQGNVTATTNAAGVATFTNLAIAGTIGTRTLSFSAPGLTGVSADIALVAGAASLITRLPGGPISAVVGTAVTNPPVAIVRDADGNVVAGTQVTFAVASGGGSITGTTPTSDANGFTPVGSWTLGTTAGPNSLSATAPGLSGSPVTFTATGTPGPATAIIAAAGNNQTATVGTAVAVKPSVKLRDAHGNVVPGVAVTFAVAGGGGSITSATRMTGSDGVATVGSWTLGTVAGPNTLTATAAGLTGSPLTFTATASAGSASGIAIDAGNNQSAVVGTATAVKPSVKITDANGNAVSGTSVTFAVASGGGSVTGASPVTGADGIATLGGWTLGTTSGSNTLTASASGLTGSPLTFTATGTPGAATTIALNAGNNQSGTSGSALPTNPSVKVTDANGNAVGGAAVTFAVASGGGSVTGATPASGADGIATVGSWTLGTVAGSNTLTASGAGLTGSPLTFTATGTAGPASSIAIDAGNNQSATSGSAVPTRPSAKVTDAHGNVVAGVVVTFAVASGGGSIAGAAPTTDADGIATVGSWTLGTVAGSNTLTATVPGLAGSPLTFTASGTVGPASILAIEAGNNQSVLVGTAVSVNPSVKVTDANGNAVSGSAVTFAVASGGGSITGATPATGADGIAAVGSWTLGSSAGPNTLTATSSGLTGSPVTFTARGTATAPTTVALNAGNGQSAIAGSPVSVSPSVIVTDGTGAPVEGVIVAFAVAGGGGSITGATPVTGADGIATVGWTLGTVAGSNTLSATATGLTGSPVTFTATGTPGPASVISIDAGNGQSSFAATAVAVKPSVKVADANGNGVAGIAVTFAVASGGGSITAATPTSGADGVATVGSWTLGTVAGPNTLTASASGLSGSPLTFTATGTGGPASAIAINAGNNQSATAATAVAVNPSVKVTDPHGNAVTGVAVTFAVASGGGSITAATSTTGADGIATPGSWTLGAVAGSNTLTATSSGLAGSPLTFNATGTVGPASKLAFVVQPSNTAQLATISPAIQVAIQDAAGNVIAAATNNIAVAITNGTGSAGAVLAGTTTQTAVSGTAIFANLSIDSPGSGYTLTATTAGLTAATSVAFTISGATISGTITPVSTAASLATSRARADALAVRPRVGIARAIQEPEHLPDELIVTYHAASLGVARPPARQMSIANMSPVTRALAQRGRDDAARTNSVVLGTSPATLTVRLRVADPAAIEQVRQSLLANDAVARVERNAIMRGTGRVTPRTPRTLRTLRTPLAAPAREPDDPLYPDQAWHYKAIDLDRAWAITTGSSSILVAVVDDGIRFDHPDLAPNLTSDGYDFASSFIANRCGGGSINLAGDGDGSDPDPTTPALYAFNPSQNCYSPYVGLGGHGLHVAGTIGARGNDGLGVTGVNWNVRIRPVRVLNGAGFGTVYDIAQGILYAAGLPADGRAVGQVQAPSAARIINLSLGGYTTSTVVADAVTAASANGALLIASAGNDAIDDLHYPSAYPEVVSVAAVGPDLLPASYSNFGSTVDMAAPGGDQGAGSSSYGVYSALWSFAGNAPAYEAWDGTSMAAPHVSGVAALILAQNPSLTREQLRARLESYAADLGSPGRDDFYGAGLVNARNSLTQTTSATRAIRARLYNAATGAVVGEQAAAGGAFSFSQLRPGSYWVFGGEDEDGDAQIGLTNRRWSAFGGASTPTTIDASGASTHTASFSAGIASERESNNSTATADLLVVGGHLFGLSSDTDPDFSRILIPASGQYSFETRAGRGACGFALELDTVLDLYDSAGSLIGSNDDINFGGRNFCSRITATLSAGVYYLRVMGRGSSRRYYLTARQGP